ncbi:MAG: acetate--CoA ligase family protein [Candidatus Njordarchaeia archaeon]|nr:CoA-binding protein [Candidatus Korarchaeota archaeon]
MTTGLEPIFFPKSIAVIGGSEKPGTIGRALVSNLLGLEGGKKFSGSVYIVNIRGGTAFGMPVYKSILDIPYDVDLAVIAVPAKVVPTVLEECGKKSVKGAIIISAGFGETGEEGRKLEDVLNKIAKKWNFRYLGPNCLGIYNTLNNMDTIFNPSDRQDKPEPGDIAFLSQSGALGAAFLDFCSKENVGLSVFISYGNAANIDESDLIEYLGQETHTKVITMYVEGVKDGRKFYSLAKKVSLKKPIIIYKAGKTSLGERAVRSHTGSLAGNLRVFLGAVKQAGIVLVDQLMDLFACAKGFSKLPLPKNDEVIIVTNGGGAGVVTTDALAREGIKLKDISVEAQEKLREFLPASASVLNPIDILGDAPASRYKKTIEIAINEKPGALIVIALLQSPAINHNEFIKDMSELRSSIDTPLITILPGGRKAREVAMALERNNVPTYDDPETAVRVLKYLIQYSKWLRHQKTSE